MTSRPGAAGGPQGREWRSIARVADVIIALAALGCVAVVPFLVRSYGWRPERYLVNPLSVGMYYGLAGLALGMLVSLRLAAVYRVSVAISLMASVCFIFLGEMVLAWSGLDFDRVRRAAATSGFDMRDRHTVLLDLAREGRPAVPTVNPVNLLRRADDGSQRSVIELDGRETLPLAGVSDALTVFCNESGQYVIYRSDEHGFHNPAGLWQQRSMDVVAVGDSFTQGTCVPSEQNAVALIRHRLPATLNLGMANAGPLAELGTLTEYAAALAPRTVLWLYCEGNDLEDLAREADTPLLAAYLRDGFTQNLASRQPAIDAALREFIASFAAPVSRVHPSPGPSPTLLDRLKPVVKLEQFRQRVGLASTGHRYEPQIETRLDLFGRVLETADRRVRAWGGRLYFVYLPEWLRYAAPRTASEHREAVLTMAASLGIPTIDLHAAFTAHGDPLALFPFRDTNSHYSADGYRLVADEVLRAVTTGKGEE